MIVGLKPYPAVRPSGVEWLGDVPAHWQVGNMGSRLTPRSERNQPELPLLSVLREKGVVRRSDLAQKENHNFVPDDLSNYKVVGAGDLVINKMKAWQGSLGIAPCDGIVSPAYFVFRMAIEDREFGQRLLRSRLYVDALARVSDGVRIGQWDLSIPGLKRIPLVLPPPEEQQAIARFLADVDRRFSRLVHAKQRLIRALEERKHAIIHSAVTSSPDGGNCRCPTGNSWFPELPDGWKVVSLRRVITRTVDGPHHSPQYFDSGVPFLSARNIRPGEWNLGTEKFISEADYEDFCRRIKPSYGDVLYTKGGTTGVALAVDRDFRFQVWVHIAVLKLRNDKILPKYLEIALNSSRCYEQSQLFTRGATNQDLGLGRMKDIVLPLPPKVEQAKIVEAVRAATRELDETLRTTRSEVRLLGEYRIKLIADIVTGKLDVRAAAAALPLAGEPVGLSQAGSELDDVDDEIDADGETRAEVEELA